MRRSSNWAVRIAAFASTGVLAIGAASPALANPSPAPTSSPGATTDGPAHPDTTKPQPIDFAVVVDESGSISPTAMTDEEAAASLLTQSELSPDSQAMVIGFGSSDRAGQTPVDEVCSLVALDTAGRQRLSSCVNGLHARTADQGNDTDIPAALQQAVSRLTAIPGPAHPRIVFLLTDGRLDVPNSPQYGQPADRNNAAENLLRTSVLPAAAQGGVQIWPLGFGSDVDPTELRDIAAGGLQSRCANLPSATPRATTVAGSGDVDVALQQAFAAARCGRFTPGTQGVPPTDLYVTIPPIATDGSITVTKRDPRVAVTYYDPAGNKVPTSGSFDGSTFDVSGQDGPVEALRITDPLPGKWRINLIAPAGSKDLPVSTGVLWQGVLHSSISLTPPQPRPGERTSVQVRLQTRRGVVISDPADLDGIHVSIRLTGTGVTPLDVPLADDGTQSDVKAGDGVFSGYLTMPGTAHGDVSVVGDVVADGVTGDQRPIQAVLLDAASPVIATPTLTGRQVYAGDSVRGSVVVRNNDTKAHTLALTLADLDPKSQVQVTPASFAIPAGTQRTVPFTLAFGAGSPLGTSPGQLLVTDTTAGGRLLGSTFIQVDVRQRPGWPERNWPLLAGTGVLLLALAGAAVAWSVSRRRARDPQGLTVHLRYEGTEAEPLLVRQSDPNGFGFSVTPEGRKSTMRRAMAGPRYVLFRRGNGARLRTPTGAWHELKFEDPIQVGPDLELSVTSDRHGMTGGPAKRPPQPRPGDELPAMTAPGSTGRYHDHPDM